MVSDGSGMDAGEQPCGSIEDALLAYEPILLTAIEWCAARPNAIQAIMTTQPKSVSSALADLSRLCGFLALTPEWDHRSPPSLHALITTQAIGQHDGRLADKGLSDSSRHQAEGVLRRVARALQGGRPRMQGPSGRKPVHVMHHSQLDDLIRAATRGPGDRHEALTLVAQIGAGVSDTQATRLRAEDLNCFAGTISVDGNTVSVLADLKPLMPRAQRGLRRTRSLETGALLPDALARPLWLLTHLQAGTPVAVLHWASQRASAAGLRRHELERLRTHLHHPNFDQISPNVGSGGSRTLSADLLTAVKALTRTPDVTGSEVPNPMPTKNPVAASHRRTSRAAALRAAKKSHAESQLAKDPVYLEARLTDIPGWQSLPIEVRDQVLKYRPLRVPRKEWEQVHDIARRLMALRLIARHAAGEPTSVRKANVIGSHLAPYLVWARRALEHTTSSELALLVLEDTTLDRYTDEAMQSDPRATVATRRSEVRGALRAARPGPRPTKLPYRPVRPPYVSAEVAYHVRLAKNQPTASRRRGVAFIVAAGYGAGLDPRDMATVRRQDIFVLDLPDGELAVAIKVAGDRPRTVVVRRDYQDLLLFAVQTHREEGRATSGLMLGRKPGRRNVTTPALERLVTAEGREVVIEVSRLRSTWLVAQMSTAVPLGVLLAAAGLRSVRALADLLPYTVVPDEDTCLALLRGKPGMLLASHEDDAA